LKDEGSILSFINSVLNNLRYINEVDVYFESKLKALSKKLYDLRNIYDSIKFIVPENDELKLDKEFDQKMDDFLVEIGVWRKPEDDCKVLGDREWDIEMRQILWRARYVNLVEDFNQLYEYFWVGWTNDNKGGREAELIFKNLNKWKMIVPPAL
jgi:hypothetical protein